MKDTNFDEVLRLAREIQSDPSDQRKAQTLAQQVIELDRGLSSGSTTYPSRWSAPSQR
jgi:hypothetical protein